MKIDNLLNIIKSHVKVVQDSKNDLITNVLKVSNLIKSSIQKGGKILIIGNGGSAADAQHFATELVVRFTKKKEKRYQQ